MKKTKLVIGKIPYANLFPIYYYLERECNHSEYKFINGVPSSLNKMLKEGKIDVSPSSSIEYLRHKDKYSIIPWLAISASGPIRSIFLFSALPLKALDKKTIAVSSHSETSVALLKIILKDFLSLNCRFKSVDGGNLKKILKSFPACLLIGDPAMREAKKLSTVKPKRVSRSESTRRDAPTAKGRFDRHPPTIYTYDLGELWFKHTGLPFVFALWMIRKKSLLQKNELIKKLSSDLINAKDYVRKRFFLIARRAPQRKWLSTKELLNYWEGISYDFTEKHMEGLRLFEKYAFKK